MAAGFVAGCTGETGVRGPRRLDLRAGRPAGQPGLPGPGTGTGLSPAPPRPRGGDARGSLDAKAATSWLDDPDATVPEALSPSHLLLVDDDPLDGELVRIALSEVAGSTCRITTVVRLAEARERLAGGDFDCVLLDLALPDSSGLDTVAGVVSAAPDLAVVVLTGLDDELTALAAVQAGAQDYLSKRDMDGPVLWRTVRYAMERKRAEVAARHHAAHDPLTGLANRVLFVDRLDFAMSQLDRRTGYIGVLFIDLDRFKWVNDSLGHAAGDALLIALSRRIEGTLRPHDLAARLGGDEFLVLCESLPSEFAASEVADRIHAVLSIPFEIGDTEIWISASIGIGLCDQPGVTPGELIQDADTAMYRAKHRGRSRTELFDVAMRDRAESRLRTSNDLHRALVAREFVVHYQPVVDLATRQWIGAEALVRWQHPDGRLVLPVEFMPLAEETGLVVPIGDFVLQTVCRQLAGWQARPGPGAHQMVTVNVSARQLGEASFPDRVRSALATSGVDPVSLGLELTETALMSDEEVSLSQLLEIEALGVKLYMDDFGTGYSSLTYLKRFPFHALKIDTSFIDGLGVDEQDTAIVDAIISLGRALRLGVVAEGVETEDHVERLLALGCQFGQGYLFGRPTPDRTLIYAPGPVPGIDRPRTPDLRTASPEQRNLP